MTKALNGLFLLTLIGVFGGMLLNGTSVVVSLLMTGPVAVVAFLVFSFVYFSIAVIFGKPKKLLPEETLDVDIWRPDALIQSTNG